MSVRNGYLGILAGVITTLAILVGGALTAGQSPFPSATTFGPPPTAAASPFCPAPAATAGLSAPPASLPTTSISPSAPAGSPDAGTIDRKVDRSAARAALQAFLDDTHAGHMRAAWDRLSTAQQADWNDFETFKRDGRNAIDDITSVSDDRAGICDWSTGADISEGDLSRASLLLVTHGAHANNWMTLWLAAPDLTGRWLLWIVRF